MIFYSSAFLKKGAFLNFKHYLYAIL